MPIGLSSLQTIGKQSHYPRRLYTTRSQKSMSCDGRDEPPLNLIGCIKRKVNPSN